MRGSTDRSSDDLLACYRDDRVVLRTGGEDLREVVYRLSLSFGELLPEPKKPADVICVLIPNSPRGHCAAPTP